MEKPTDYYKHARKEMLRFLPGNIARVLDVGCGNGRFGALIKDSRGAVEVWGVEPTKAACDQAAAVLDRAVHGFFGPELELPDSYFDAVVFNDSLEHFPDHLVGLRHARKALRPSGRIVMSIPNVRFWPHMQRYLLDGDWKYEDAGILDRTHLRFFTRKSIVRDLEESGFVIETVEGINPCWVGYKLRLIERIFGRKADDLRYEQFAVVARLAG